MSNIAAVVAGALGICWGIGAVASGTAPMCGYVAWLCGVALLSVGVVRDYPSSGASRGHDYE